MEYFWFKIEIPDYHLKSLLVVIVHRSLLPVFEHIASLPRIITTKTCDVMFSESKCILVVASICLSDTLLFKKPQIMFVLNSVSVFKNLHISFFLLHIFLSHTFVKFYNDHKSFITSTKLIWMHFAKNLQSLTELSFLVFTYLWVFSSCRTEGLWSLKVGKGDCWRVSSETKKIWKWINRWSQYLDTHV